MKTIVLSLCLAVSSLTARAQDVRHYTEGPGTLVKEITVEYGHFEEYIDWLKSTWKPTMKATKKAGIIIDYKVFSATPQSPDRPGIILWITYQNMGALDRDVEEEEVAKNVSREAMGTEGVARHRHQATSPETNALAASFVPTPARAIIRSTCATLRGDRRTNEEPRSRSRALPAICDVPRLWRWTGGRSLALASMKDLRPWRRRERAPVLGPVGVRTAARWSAELARALVAASARHVDHWNRRMTMLARIFLS